MKVEITTEQAELVSTMLTEALKQYKQLGQVLQVRLMTGESSKEDVAVFQSQITLMEDTLKAFNPIA